MTTETSLIDILDAQERALVFPTFHEETALEIGERLVRAARLDQAPVCH